MARDRHGVRVRTYKDLDGVLYRIGDGTGAELLFSATQYAVEQLAGGQRRCPPLTWVCPQCGELVLDRAPDGRPVHVEHGHTAGCARLARDHAAEDQRRREQVPGLILHFEPAVGPVQRHWLREPITDDCPRCGWHGYFHHYLAHHRRRLGRRYLRQLLRRPAPGHHRHG